jgi:very-short-patch-repair endonuclease
MGATDTPRAAGWFSGQCEPDFEVDGAYHDERGGGDARRDAALERAIYRVVRIEAWLVVSDVEGALDRIRAALAR